ncbi:MAG: hypothetical protein AAFX93_11000 [Verrucomicrobiota bacterium]
MKGLSIALRILAILGAIAAVVAWLLTNGKVEEITAQKNSETNRANVSASQVETLESDILSIRSENTQLSSDNADLDSRVKTLQSGASRDKREISNIRKDMKSLQAEYNELTSDYDDLKKEVQITANSRDGATSMVDSAQIQEYEDRIQALNDELDGVKDKLVVAERRALNATGGLIAPAGDTTGGGSAAPGSVPQVAVPTKTASILRSDLDRGILIISRGQVDGLQKQMEFSVAKGLSRKVRVKVGSVAPTYSVAYVLPGEDPSHLQEGDEVKITQ